MRKTTIATLFVLAALAAGLWLGCSTAPTGSLNQNKPPETYIVNVPPGIDTINAVSLVYWYGTDEDGVVAYYEWFVSGDSVNPSQITGWDSIFASSDTMKLTVDDVPDSLIVLDTIVDTVIIVPDTFYDVREIWHFRGYFYVRAVDDEGMRDPMPAQRGWSVYSEKPVIEIVPPDTMANDLNSGLLKYYDETRPYFWFKTDTPVMFYLDHSTPSWKGLQFWWSRIDTLNPEWNMPIGYRYKIDNDIWSEWTDMNPNTAGDSFITVTQNLNDGLHVFYLQGRNASHVQSNVDSLAFRTINPNLDAGEILVLMATTQTYNNLNWYVDLFNTIRPNTTVRFINRNSGVLPKDSLKNAKLVIYVRDDPSTFISGFSRDTLALEDYLNCGGRLWTFGLNFFNQLDTFGIGGTIVKKYLGVEYYTNCSGNWVLDGAAPSSYASTYGLPQDTLYVEMTHNIPPVYPALAYVENLRTSDPNITVIYKWIGPVPWTETPIGVFHSNPSMDIKSVSFSFGGRVMQWDAVNYEPIASIYDAVLVWFGL
ncbi:hypothetical protein JXL83_03380 [candidate division WOR-3 bacterium]|nr:hypothetical protein [candidate division WOR-3 bacterium]